MDIDRSLQLEKIINYKFNNKENLILALTHSSYANEIKKGNQCNERMEFLGDAVLELIISEHIYTKYKDLPEGDMTKIRSNLVCATTLAVCADKINLGDFLFLGKGEDQTGGRKRVSILSDAFESLIGSIYIDGGLKKVRDFILNQMSNVIKDCINGKLFMDYKTHLQEAVHKFENSSISYDIVSETGPDHDKIFVSDVLIGGKVSGRGTGSTKKESEQMAAKMAIKNL